MLESMDIYLICKLIVARIPNLSTFQSNIHNLLISIIYHPHEFNSFSNDQLSRVACNVAPTRSMLSAILYQPPVASCAWARRSHMFETRNGGLMHNPRIVCIIISVRVEHGFSN
jgi:hypothetical protein